MTAGQRLQAALDAWDQGIMAFVEQMKEKLKGTGVRGATYPAVRRYLAGEARPSIEFLEAAAWVLGVRREWLVAGQGEMTAEKERVRVAAQSMTTATAGSFIGGERNLSGMPLQRPTTEVVSELLQSINQALGLTKPDDIPPWSSGVIEVWKRLAESVTYEGRTHTQMITDALSAPLEALVVDPDAMHQKGDLTLYITAMIPALLVAAGEVERRVLEEETLPDEEDWY